MITSYFKRKAPAADEQKSPKKVKQAPVSEEKKSPKSNNANDAKMSDEIKERIAANKRQALEKRKRRMSHDFKVESFSDLKAGLHPSWCQLLRAEFNKPYFKGLQRFLESEEKKGATIFPPKNKIFAAFNVCPLESVRVVIIGQDPYHGPGQAEGLCFSVPIGVKIPSSLRNIYKEIGTNYKSFVKPTHGHLMKWAHQGVLLLNTGLTVRSGQANSHKGKGWQQFTDAVISALTKETRGLVFLLWGKHAQDRSKRVAKNRGHVLLKSVHPSGLSAHRGFFGNGHFKKCNSILTEKGKQPIKWQV